MTCLESQVQKDEISQDWYSFYLEAFLQIHYKQKTILFV